METVSITLSMFASMFAGGQLTLPCFRDGNYLRTPPVRASVGAYQKRTTARTSGLVFRESKMGIR